MDTTVGRVPEANEYAEQITRLNAESVQHKQRLDWQDKQIEELRVNYLALTTQQTGTKALVEGLHNRFEGIDTRLFGVFQQMTKDNAQLLQKMTVSSTKERQEGCKERTISQASWFSFAKYLVGGTIVALITYIFTKG